MQGAVCHSGQVPRCQPKVNLAKQGFFFFLNFGHAAQHVESYFPDQGLNLLNPEPKPLDSQESPRQNFLKITHLRPVVLTLFCRGSSVRT